MEALSTEQVDDTTTTRVRVRRSRPVAGRGGRRPKKGERPPRGPLFYFGVALIAAGLAVLAWLAWQFWGTNWQSQQKQDDVSSALQDAWSSGQNTAVTDFGNATAILHVPRFGDDYAVPVLEGESDEVLAAGIGHMDDTGEPGAVGNYVLAGHRVTHGEPFADFPELRDGDLVYVETHTATYTYELDLDGTDLVVPFTDMWVTDPQPVNPDGGPQPPAAAGDRLITLLTCSELFHTDNRSVVFGHLVGTETAGAR